MNFERNLESPKERAIKKIAKALTAFVAAGIMTFGAGTQIVEAMKGDSSAKKYIEYSERYAERKESNAGKLGENLRYLEQRFSPLVIGHLMKACQVAETGDRLPTNPKISGFEKIGISNERLRELWSNKFYPAGTIEGNIEDVRFSDESRKSSADYNIPNYSAAETKPFVPEIAFYQSSENTAGKKDVLETLDWHFSHELGHLIDWDSLRSLSPGERVEFLSDVSKVFEKSGSYRDPLGYIESINNQDKQKENYYKTNEYWATLCETYLTFPESAKAIFLPDEIRLIEKWFLQKDKSFDPIKAHAEREAFIENSL